MPADDGLGLDEHEGPAPFGPETGQGHPQKPIGWPKRDFFWFRSVEDSQLMTESQNLDLKRGTTAERRGQAGEQRNQQITHGSGD